MAQPLEHTVEITLRWRDIDIFGHVNQSVYHELLEEARAGLMADLFRRAGDDANRGGFVVRHVELDHLHEIRRDEDVVIVTARVVGVGNSSIRIANEIRLRDGTVSASGITVLAGWDPAARGKRTISDREREILGV